MSGALSGTSDSLAENARDTAQVAADVRRARGRIDDLAAAVESFRPQPLAERGVSSLELGMRALLGLLAVQAALSLLTGLALLLLAGARQADPERQLVAA
jgi:hypothetical protein